MHRTPVLVVLCALAALLAALTIWDRAGGEGPAARVPRQIAPGLDSDQITSITFERPGADRVVLVRRGGRFVVTEPLEAPADAAVVRDLLDTLELLSWRRRVSGDEARSRSRGLDPPRLTLRIERKEGEPLRLALGAKVPQARGAWLQVGDRPEAYLVEAYAAAALDRDLDGLRSSRPFSLDPLDADRVEVAAGDRRLVLHPGSPGGAELPGLKARADPAAAERLLQRIGDLAFASFADKTPPASGATLQIRVERGDRTETLRVLGPCPGAPGRRLASSPAGAGCVSAGSIDALAAALEKPGSLVDHRLIAGRVEHVVLEAGGKRLELDPGGEAGGAVRDWLGRLGESPTGELAISEGFRGPALATVELRYRGGRADRLQVARGSSGRLLARREGEEVAMVLAPQSAALLDPAPWRFRSRRLLLADPTDIRRATAREGGEVVADIARGDHLGAWRAEAPPGAHADPEAMERLARAVAPLRAIRAVAGRAAADHRLARPRRVVELVLDPPPGEAESRRIRIEVGGESEQGCYARMAGDPVVFELSRDRCQALLGRWTGDQGQRVRRP